MHFAGCVLRRGIVVCDTCMKSSVSPVADAALSLALAGGQRKLCVCRREALSRNALGDGVAPRYFLFHSSGRVLVTLCITHALLFGIDIVEAEARYLAKQAVLSYAVFSR